jgi:5-methylcytosine-specific restriction endonuclease McrA
MRSKEPEYRAAYWKKWSKINVTPKNRPCPKCRQDFTPMGVQKYCRACSKQVCESCGSDFWADRKRKYCSKDCHIQSQKGSEPAGLASNRGIKPRTYHLRNRTKHGNAFDREWRVRVFDRDNYTCQICGAVGGRLQADHIRSYAAYPELRHDLSNGRTLCVRCHKATPNYGYKAVKEIAARRMSQEVMAL